MKITLAQLRTDATRAFGPLTIVAEAVHNDRCSSINFSLRHGSRGDYISVWGSSRMGARRLACQLLRRLPDWESA